MNYKVFTSLLFIVLMLSSKTAHADLAISVQNGTIAPQGSAFVDVYVTGAPGDVIGSFAYRFEISGASPTAGDLQFSLVQPTDLFNIGPDLPNHNGYILSSAPGQDGSYFSLGQFNPITADGSDTIVDLGTTEVSANGTFLLTRLQVEHTGPVSSIGDFTISLNSMFTNIYKDADQTAPYLSSEFSSTSGIISLSATAVPEPSSIALLSVAAGCGFVWKRRRKRRQ